MHHNPNQSQSQSQSQNQSQNAALTQLWIHPLKSGAGITLSSAIAAPGGLTTDREWMVTDAEGQFLTGRTHPALLHIKATPTIEGLRLNAPGMSEHSVRRARFNRRRPTGVWSYRFDAWWGEVSTDHWLSEFLGISARLLFIGGVSQRQLRSDPSVRFSFADGYPYLLLSESSLVDLNSRLVRPVTMRHFRPNLVVDGVVAFAEDGWRRFRIGSVIFDVVKPCDRCVFTTIDPDTAIPADDLQPLRTLGSYRRTEGGVMFGQNVIARNRGMIRVGDAVEVLERSS